MSGTAIVDVIRGYSSMLLLHSQMEGIHFASYFPSKPWDIQIAIILTLTVLFPLRLWHIRRKKHTLSMRLSPVHRQHLLTILSLWALLVGYHRVYDAVMYILFISLGLQLYRSPEIWRLSIRNRNIALFFIVVTSIFFMLPAGSILREFLPGQLGSYWILFSIRMTTFILSAALIITIFLLFHL